MMIKEQVKALWKICFDDSEEFVEMYFRLRENKQTEQIKSGFADLLKKYIEINDDNAVGEYIRTAYRSSL